MPADLSPTLLRQLTAAAKRAASNAYAPYSQFSVGAAVLAGSGKIYAGSNVENASFGLCTCAERSAIFAAVGQGERRLRAVVIYTPTRTATAPCGACRQVIHEFGPGTRVISVCDRKDRIDVTIEALLPGAFGPADLA